MQNILIIKIVGIGDIACALLATSHLHHEKITWVVGKKAEPLLLAASNVHHVISVDEANIYSSSFFRKIQEVLRIWKRLFFKRFDLVITAHRYPLYRALSLVTCRKKHVFFDKRKTLFPLGAKFQGYHYLSLLSKASSKPFEVPQLHLPQVNHLLPGNEKMPFVILTPQIITHYEGKELRIWPLTYYIKLARDLSKYSCQIVLVGEKKCEHIEKEFKVFNSVNLMGNTSLMELMAVLKEAVGIVTHDGGTLHLARLVECKICALFGPTSPRDFSLPGPNELALWGGDGLHCRPCYNGKTFFKCQHQSCMKQLRPEYVLQTIVKMWDLKKRENGHSS